MKVLVVLCVAFAVGLIILGMAGCPAYKVYSSEKAGQAELARAEFERRVLVVQAQAEKDAAENKKQAAIIRAQGIAEANKIIGASITPEYIDWLWVDGLNEGNNKNQIIYVPTDGLLPLLEAGRLHSPAPTK